MGSLLKKFWLISTKSRRRIDRRNIPRTLSFISIMLLPIEHREISIALESQNSLISPTALQPYRPTDLQPYSPDLALCDFWLFGMLKRKLKGHTFASAIEERTEVNNILMNIHFDDFILIFDEWKCRLRECIDRGGEYL
jgi:hypothetical protein